MQKIIFFSLSLTTMLPTIAMETRQKQQREFFEAIKHGKLDEVKSLIASGIDVDGRFENGDTPLIVAVTANPPNLDIIRAIWNEMPDKWAENLRGKTALSFVENIKDKKIRDEITDILYGPEQAKQYAIYYNLAIAPHADKRMSSLDQVDNVYNSSNPKKNFLAIAIKRNLGIDIVKKLIEKGADINKVLIGGSTPLSIAKEAGADDIVRLLTDIGAKETKIISPEMKQRHKDFFEAIKDGDLGEVKKLIATGIDIDAQDENGNTPLMIAVTADKFNIDIVRTIVNEIPDRWVTNKEGKRTEDLINQLKNEDNKDKITDILYDVKQLKQHRLWISLTDVLPDADKIMSHIIAVDKVYNSRNPKKNFLAIAIKKILGADIVKKLIDKGADVNLVFMDKSTPLSIAKNFEADDDIIQLLINEGAEEVKPISEEGAILSSLHNLTQSLTNLSTKLASKTSGSRYSRC